MSSLLSSDALKVSKYDKLDKVFILLEYTDTYSSHLDLHRARARATVPPPL